MGLGEKRNQSHAHRKAQNAMRQIQNRVPCSLVTRVLRPWFASALFLTTLLLLFGQTVNAITPPPDYEGRPIGAIEITFEGSPPDAAAEAEFLSIIKVAPNIEYSAVAIRDSLQALFESERVANARVEVFEVAPGKNGLIRLRFVIQRQVQIGDVKFELTPAVGTPISEDELRARVNLTQPGTRLTKQVILRNSDELQVFLRDHGYFNAVVEPTEQLDLSGTRATVVYRIVPGEQAHVESFNINITGFDATALKPALQLQTSASFTRDALGEDIKRIRQAIIDLGYLSPVLNDPRV